MKGLWESVFTAQYHALYAIRPALPVALLGILSVDLAVVYIQQVNLQNVLYMPYVYKPRNTQR
jgi:hypothetical protein